MRQTMPTVKRGRLYQVERENVPIDVGTPSWYNWLEEHTSFLFVDHMCAVNVRKYRVDHAEPEWKASRTRLGKVFTVSLGPSHALTFSNLRAAARRLAGKHTHNRSISLSVENPSTSRLPVAEPVTINGSMSSFMRTKLYRPRNSSDTIPRPRLIESLNVALGSEITLVCAPAGFGKSTLVIQWLQTNDRPNVWLSLDKQDNNLPIFLQSLATALQTTFPDAFEATASLLMSPRILPPDQIVALLINDLADMSEDFILVLDDYHFIHNQKVHTIIELLIEHLPPQLHLVLICRSDPPLPIIKWLTKGRLTELRGTDLRFTLEETEAFLTRLLGSEAALETASVLDERTEGWIAALRLAALSLRGTSDRAAFMERLDSYAANSISSYLVEEVLSQQTQEMQRLLECTSILEQFCAESCAAVMGNEISPEHVQATLGEMEHENLFLVVLDRHRGWYRFHHLFQELLQQRLQTHCSKDELVILHRQASEWYASQNLIEEAIRHALLAGDESTAGQLVETHFFQVFEREQLVLMEHRLQLLTEEQVHESPFLLVAQAWISQARGQLRELPRLLTSASQLLASREQYMNDTQNSSFRLLHALIATFWSLYHFFDGQPQKSLESAHTALALLQPTEKFIASHALELLAWSLQATGFEKGALASLQEVLLSQPSSMSTTARLLFSQTYVYLAMGKLPHAEQTARHLLQIALKAELAISRNYAHWLLGLVHYEQNQLDEAAYHFSAVIADQQQAHFWVVQDSLCGLALTYQAQGSCLKARETTRTLLTLVQEQNSLPEIMVTFAFHGRLALLQNGVEEASQWLEMAGEHEVQGPMFFLEDPAVTAVHLLLARGDEASVAEGQVLLSQLLHLVEATHNIRKTIQVLALQAWAYDLQGCEGRSLDVLENALTLAFPGRFIRTLADFAPLAKLMHALRRRNKAYHEVDKHLDAYLQDILAAIEQVPSQVGVREDLLVKEGLEALTRRELQILQWLDTDLTNKEIARELVVTTETVKLHTKHVYRKLNVNNRRAAVTLARSLGLLSAS